MIHNVRQRRVAMEYDRTCPEEKHADMVDCARSGELKERMCLVYLPHIYLQQTARDEASKHGDGK